MNKLKTTLTILFAFICLQLVLHESILAQQTNITVEIDYGKEKPIQTIKVTKEKNITALEALQLATSVETHPVGKYVFVTSINNVKAERGKTAWYYKVNGLSPKVLAISNELKEGDTVKWVFTKDRCSKKEDK